MIRTKLCRSLPFLALPLSFAAGANTMPGPGGTSAWTIYAFNNGDVLFNVLQSASALVANSEFRNFLLFLSTLAVLGTAVVASLTGQWRKLAMVVLAITFMITAGMSTTTSVMVDDPVSGYDNVVSNVPIIVALPESVVSTMGHEMAYLADTYFSLPNDLTATGGGAFNLATSILRDSTQVTIVDPQIRATLAAFASNCIVPSLIAARYSAYTLAQSPQLFGSGGTLSAGLQAPITLAYSDQAPQGTPVPCGSKGQISGYSVASTKYAGGSGSGVSSPYSNAYDYLSDALAEGSPSWLGTSAGAMQGTAAYTWMSTALTSAQSYLFNGQMTQPTGETISQAAAINALTPALNQAAIASGQSQMVSAMAVAQGEKTQVSSWATAVALFTDLAGYIYSVLQSFLVALTPILLVSAFMPGVGWKMVLSYVKICLWLAMWMPVLSMISFIVSVYAQDQLPATLGGSGGYSMISMTAVSTATEHLVLAAGFLATLTPLITWAIVNGTFAFTEFLAEGLGHKMASLAGSIAASGNISLDNQQFRNTTLDQQMLASKTTAGAQSPTNYSPLAGATQDIFSAGGAAIETASGRSSKTTQSSNSANVAQSVQRMKTASSIASSSLDNAISAGVSLDKTITESGGHGISGGTNTNASSNSRIGQQVDDSVKTGLRTMESQGYDTTELKTAYERGDLNATQFAAGAAAAARGSKGLAQLASAGGKWGAIASMFGAATASGGVQKNLQNALSNKGSSETNTGHDVSSGEAASADRSAALAKVASDVFSAESNYASRISGSAGETARRAASLTQSAANSLTEVSQAQKGLSEATSVSMPDMMGGSDVLRRFNLSREQNTPIPEPGSVRQQVNAENKAIGDSLTPASRLSVDAGQATDAAAAAAKKAASQTAPVLSQVADAKKPLENFGNNLAAVEGQSRAHAAAADAAKSETATDAAGKVQADTDKTKIAQDEVTLGYKIDDGKVQKGTTGLNPVPMVSPSSMNDRTGDALETAAASAGGVAKQMATDKVTEEALKRAASTAAGGGEAIEAGAVAAGGGASAVGGTTAGATVAAEGTVGGAATVGGGTAAIGTTTAAGAIGLSAVTGLAIGEAANHGYNYVGEKTGLWKPQNTVMDAVEGFRIEHSPGAVAKDPGLPNGDDFARRSATNLTDQEAVQIMREKRESESK